METFVDQLIARLSVSSRDANVRRHADSQRGRGEFSFALRPFGGSCEKTIPEVAFPDCSGPDDALERLVVESRRWAWPIARCVSSGSRAVVHLDRLAVTERHFSRAERSEVRTKGKLRATRTEEPVDDVTQYRVRLLCSFAERIARKNGYEIATDDEDDSNAYSLCFSSKTAKESSSNRFHVFCGPVLDGKTGTKRVGCTRSEYLEQRTIDMELKARHKYRIEVYDEEKWKSTLIELGHAAAIFELLQVKPSHPVNVNLSDGGSGRSKGACFVLYNAARLHSIVSSFEENVRQGVHPPLPSVDEIDFSLLDDEDEWNIVFNYLSQWESVVRECFEITNGECRIAPHRLCCFLSSLAEKFSSYYRRVKILLDPRPHLLSKIYARVHLAVAVHSLIDEGLSLLGVGVLSRM